MGTFDCLENIANVELINSNIIKEESIVVTKGSGCERNLMERELLDEKGKVFNVSWVGEYSKMKHVERIIKGPDFSNKAPVIISDDELEEIYSIGKGGFKAQAHWIQNKNEIKTKLLLTLCHTRHQVQKFLSK